MNDNCIKIKEQPRVDAVAPSFMHKGCGSPVMKAFLRDYVFSERLFFANLCAIGPEPDNISAIRMYEKTGFHWIKTVRVAFEDEPEYIMVIHKDESV
jgi:aminoglycoside 6'-N-acetyltransferase